MIVIDRSLLSTDYLFTMGIKDLMYHLEGIVKNWFHLGMELGLPMSKLEEIECNNSSNVLKCKPLMLQEWQRRPTLKPSWCVLVDALHRVQEITVADRISQHFSELHLDQLGLLHMCILIIMLYRVLECCPVSTQVLYLFWPCCAFRC